MYKLEFTDEQMRIVEKALDLYSRVLSGQVEEVSNVLLWDAECLYDCDGNKIDTENIHKFTDIIKNSKSLLGLPPNGHHGIFNHYISDIARKAYDIEKTMAFHRVWNNDKKNPDSDERDWKKQLSHWYDFPKKHSYDENYNLPKVEVNE